MTVGRFTIEAAIKDGGMGVIYRALDTTTGKIVALKMQAATDADARARFLREGMLLSDLDHPGIVKFVAHGVASDGRMYLAMEWLEGEDLAARLERGALPALHALQLAQRAANALGYLHGRGILHRDVKPSNLFLEDKDLARVRLLDFGVARASHASAQLTRTGLGLGSIGYMAPEQARGERELDARADVFSLGCVLFHCLTGSPAFVGDDAVAILVKSLFEPAPRLRQTLPHLPEALDAFVHRMLDKQAEKRPRDMQEVKQTLAALALDASLSTPEALRAAAPVNRVLTASEQRLLWVVLARARQSNNAVDDTLVTKTGSLRTEQLMTTAQRYGASLELPFDGSAVATLLGSGAATDQAAQAARLALELKTQLPEHVTVLTAGRGVVAGQSPVGEAVDRAVMLWHRAVSEDEVPVVTDALTAALLDGRFDTHAVGSGTAIVGERARATTARTLLGKRTPCVGRERELAMLEGLAREAFDEPVARAVIVTAPAGVGKSRLRNELLQRLSGVTVCIGRGDALSAGSAFSILGEAVRAAFPPHADFAAVLAHLSLLTIKDAERVGEFLAVLMGMNPPVESVQLRAARQDSQLLGDQMQRAFEDWLRAECERRPVLLVFEDLHWGDVPSVRFVDVALRNLADCRLMVLALARPEVHELFARLWVDRGAQELRLSELTKRASEKLVRDVLGELATTELVERLVSLAAGNAFYLEELIRQAAEGGGGELPETVLAMLDGRLQALPAPERQVLRAGSVFGRRFWLGGVAKLLDHPGDLAQRVQALIASEILLPSPDSRFNGERELVFRHDLFREAAYATLSERDKSSAHALAGEWLQAQGGADAMALAEHFERGAEPERASSWYHHAAEDALAGNDWQNARRRVERALMCGCSDDTRGALLLVSAEASNWAGAFSDAERDAGQALRFLSGDKKMKAIGELATAAGVQGHVDVLTHLLAQLPTEVGPNEALAGARLAEQLMIAGDPLAASTLVRRLEAASLNDSPEIEGRVLGARASEARFHGHSEAYLALVEQALAAFDAAGDARHACMRRGQLGYAYLELGQHEKSVALLEGVITEAERMGLANVSASAMHNLGLALSRLGQSERAIAMEQLAIAAFAASGNRRMEGASHEYLALIYLAAGRSQEAEASALRAVAVAEISPVLPLNLAESLAILALALLPQGRAEEAYRWASQALAGLESLGGIDDGESLIRLVYAQSLYAIGETQRARSAFASAKERLLLRASRIAAPGLRDSFLHAIPENAKTLALAE